jgi:CDP-diacylglycerol---serine O-phosphatidyltransferase
MSEIPRRVRSWRRRAGVARGIYLLPNLITTASLFLGFYSMVLALHHKFLTAAWLLFFAGLCDNLDGRVARYTGTASEFGIEYDSLADVITFGLAPVILLYSWSLASFPRLGWVVTFVYVAAAALRLARYNVQVTSVERRGFQGLPVPMAAAMIVSAVIFYHEQFGPVIPVKNWWLVLIPVVTAGLMVSNVPYRSTRDLKLTGRGSFFSLVVIVGLFTLIVLKPGTALFSMATLYVVSGFIELVLRKKSVEQAPAHPNVRHLSQSHQGEAG